MCWFHMKCKATDKLALIDDVNLRNEMIQNIQVLHNAPSEELFDTAVKLFFKKWRAQKNAQINEYLDYFNSEWIVAHKGWFLGYFHGPTTNNGLESNNKLIKKHCGSSYQWQIFLKKCWLLFSDGQKSVNQAIFFAQRVILPRES